MALYALTWDHQQGELTVMAADKTMRLNREAFRSTGAAVCSILMVGPFESMWTACADAKAEREKREAEKAQPGN